MPKIQTSKAAKDYPNEGIKKGDTYYSWSFYRGPTIRSKTYPKRSQTTASPNLSAAYAVTESYEEARNVAKSPEEVIAAIDEAVSEADNVLEQYDETISNLEEAFTGGCPNLDTAQEQRDALDEFKEALESARSEIEGLTADEFDGKDGADFADCSEEVQSAWMARAVEIAEEPEFSA